MAMAVERHPTMRSPKAIATCCSPLPPPLRSRRHRHRQQRRLLSPPPPDWCSWIASPPRVHGRRTRIMRPASVQRHSNGSSAPLLYERCPSSHGPPFAAPPHTFGGSRASTAPTPPSAFTSAAPTSREVACAALPHSYRSCAPTSATGQGRASSWRRMTRRCWSSFSTRCGGRCRTCRARAWFGAPRPSAATRASTRDSMPMRSGSCIGAARDRISVEMCCWTRCCSPSATICSNRSHRCPSLPYIGIRSCTRTATTYSSNSSPSRSGRRHAKPAAGAAVKWAVAWAVAAEEEAAEAVEGEEEEEEPADLTWDARLLESLSEARASAAAAAQPTEQPRTA